MKKVLIYLFIFFIIGELMIRFDESYTILEENRMVKISTDIEITQEYQLLKNKSFVFNKNDLRIMVLGDSYIHGGGIEFKDNFSQQLKKIFQKESNTFDNIWVLDVSMPDSNNFDNNKSYFQFVDEFKPNIVILGYNMNDVNGNLDKQKNQTEIENFTKIKTSGGESRSVIRKIYNFIYQSHLAHYVMHNSHNELKSYGLVIRNSNFDITMRSYFENRENWQKSKILLREIIDDTRKKNIQLIVYKFPEINLLEYPQLFTDVNESIKSFFDGYPSVIYMDGMETFKGDDSKQYILSKYDGHPNEKAHYKMAKSVFKTICKNERSTSHFINK